MRKAIQFLGAYLVLSGISGVVDHLAVQPVMGVFLNFFNRVVIPRVDFLTGYEVFANLVLSAIGVAVVVAAERTEP
ncbi:hypothetical protein [Actinorugispora endophytica]|uniref:Uncharacterized protein n=1 Tax=Actinorugispora endophytica TaxID=1605990 RepID=A0A4V3D923_9ACTN|nr:hypothetical protein [Actinorugispora endophytica]TDQ54179.1 hypothetical protein EV190_10211 [Actinorugispora endophytica]